MGSNLDRCFWFGSRTFEGDHVIIGKNEDGFVVAVAAIVVRGDRVLAMRRSPTKDAGPGLWETLSGRVEPDEVLEDAVLREIAEESGLRVRLWPRPVDAYVVRRLDRPMCVVVYRADWVNGEVVRSEEHDAHAWWTPAEFRDNSTLTRLADAIDRAMALDPRSQRAGRKRTAQRAE
jgi:8-oxo-dGTP diphosphatase